jgi:hypothetical protein
VHRAWTAPTPADRARLLAEAKQSAAELLARQAVWPKELADDTIWHAATAAEAHLLAGAWDQAKLYYAKALAAAAGDSFDFYQESIGGQLHRILRALSEMKLIPAGQRRELEKLFS